MAIFMDRWKGCYPFLEPRVQALPPRSRACWRNSPGGFLELRSAPVYGEGPNMIKAGSFQGNSIRSMGVKDIRFTRNKANTVVYALVLGWPHDAFLIQSLGTASAAKPGKIAHVQLLGTEEKLHWKQSATALRVELPKYRPATDYAVALKVVWA